jgi:hypothetical protein
MIHTTIVENTTYADLIKKFNLSGEKPPNKREYILAGIKIIKLQNWFVKLNLQKSVRKE